MEAHRKGVEDVEDIKNVVELLESVCDKICDKYCKFPEVYCSQYKDEDKAYEVMLEEKCVCCPLNKLC